MVLPHLQRLTSVLQLALISKIECLEDEEPHMDG